VTALCFLDDCIEYGDQELFALVNTQAMGKFLEVLQKRGAENTDLVQNCVYGMGLVASRVPTDQFSGQLESVLNSVKWTYD
jgi:hypothetical protein